MVVDDDTGTFAGSGEEAGTRGTAATSILVKIG